MKVILPVAGKGERMRPYTNDLPKCLLPVGGKTIIDWIVEDALQLEPSETIFITGYKAEKMDQFLETRPKWGRTRTVLQGDPQGLGQAISLALPYVEDDEPLLIILGDTLFDADLSALADAPTNVLYTYKVSDPRRFGVAVTDSTGNIQRLVEKPQEFVSDEAIVGIYYIKDVKSLRAALKHLMDNDIRTRGEFQLTDALQMMLEQGCKFRTAPVREWLDCGLPETLVQTNTWLLQNKDGLNNVSRVACDMSQDFHDVKLVPPCIIGRNCVIEGSTVGPNVTLGDNCVIVNAMVENCIVYDGETVKNQDVADQIIAGEM
ncbi:MAG: NTP transferase domain-containing protein [Fibrobacter sp.]|nr:NTP transferase domain-containing protein [Fibrobacter sp.]